MINLKEICKMHCLSTKEVAKRLWPENKNPYHSFWRHCKYGIELTETQISIIAEITGKSHEELKSANWKSSQPQSKIIRFEKNGYKIQLCLTDHSTRIYGLNAKIHEVTLSDKTTKLSEYFEKVDQLIETIDQSRQINA